MANIQEDGNEEYMWWRMIENGMMNEDNDKYLSVSLSVDVELS